MNQLIRKVWNSRSCNRLQHRITELDCPTVHLRIVWGIIAFFLLNPVTGFTDLELQTVNSVSMMPELKEGDRLIVNMFFISNLRRDAIIAFQTKASEAKQQVKEILTSRVIGLPGEKVQIKGGEIYIDNHLLKQEKTVAKPNHPWGPQVIPPNSYFVLGDNRNSRDGKLDWEIVGQDRIVGLAVLRLWPLNRGSFVTNWGPTKGSCQISMMPMAMILSNSCNYKKDLLPNLGRQSREIWEDRKTN